MNHSLPVSPEALIALGAFAGMQLLVLCFSVIIASTHRERALMLHGGSVLVSLLALQALVGEQPYVAQAAMLVLMSVDGMQLRELVSHGGALRAPRRWLVAGSIVALPLMAVATVAFSLHLLLPGAAIWAASVAVVMLRAWPQSQPWAGWLVTGQVALGLASVWLGWRSLDADPDPALPLAAMLSVWAAVVYLATVWRSRLHSETRVRIDARSTVDPLTRLAMPVIFYERVSAVRNLMRRYGHPSVMMLVHIEKLDRLAAEFGPEVAESALVTAAVRVRETLREGDIAARLSHSRIGVLVEGMGPAEASANIASRILVAGLKEPLPAAPTEFLRFRIVLAAVPTGDEPPKAILQRMATRMDEQLKAPGDRRIHTLTAEELQP